MYMGGPKAIEKNEETRIKVQLRSTLKEDANHYLNWDFLVIWVKGVGSKTIKLKKGNTTWITRGPHLRTVSSK